MLTTPLTGCGEGKTQALFQTRALIETTEAQPWYVTYKKIHEWLLAPGEVSRST